MTWIIVSNIIAVMNYEPEIDTLIELQSWDYVLPDPADALMQKDISRIVLEAVDTLTPRESKVIKLRFGLDRDHDHTLEQIANIFNVTRERIRQIEAKALRKLRHPSRSKFLLQETPAIKLVAKEEKIEVVKPLKNRIEPVKPVPIPTDEKGWVDGNKYRPTRKGVYERTDGSYVAFSKWSGKAWLAGSDDVYLAALKSDFEKSAFQKINWRSIKTGGI